MKTPSFLELQSLVEYLSEELEGSQLQEVQSTEEGIVLAFYRFDKNPRMSYLVFDLDRTFPFVGFFFENPWAKQKKTKPVALFLNAHARNLHFNSIEVSEDLGRVILLKLGEDCHIESRLIPKQTNFTVQHGKKSISWYPVQELAQNDLRFTRSNDDEEIRSIAFMMEQWLRRRGNRAESSTASVLSPFDRWKKNKTRDLEKKTKALLAVEKQINQFKTEEWAQVGEYLKSQGLKNLPPEWSVYVDFKKSASWNMQKCFEKAKAAKVKIKGAEARLLIIKQEVDALSDLSEQKFEKFLNLQHTKKAAGNPVRKVEGRLRKMQMDDSGLVAYMGKSAGDNMDLLRRSKPHDLWLHLKDYPSAHAIIHKQKDQKIADSDIIKIAGWLVKEGLPEKKAKLLGKFSVVIVECRHVKPLKGDKLGRVTYHNAREMLIAV